MNFFLNNDKLKRNCCTVYHVSNEEEKVNRNWTHTKKQPQKNTINPGGSSGKNLTHSHTHTPNKNPKVNGNRQENEMCPRYVENTNGKTHSNPKPKSLWNGWK